MAPLRAEALQPAARSPQSCGLQRPAAVPAAPLAPRRRGRRVGRLARAAPAPESSATSTAEAQASLLSEAEKFVLEMAEAEAAPPPPAPRQPAELQAQLAALRSQVGELSAKIDALYSMVLVGVVLPAPAEGDEQGAAAAAALATQLAEALPDPAALTEARFGELGRSSPKVRASSAG